MSWRTAVQGDVGFPDLVLVRAPRGEVGARLIFAELKAEKGKESPEQTDWLDELFDTSIEGAYGCGESTRCEGVRFEVERWRPSDWNTIVEVLK